MKKLLTLLLTISIVTSTVYTPIFTPRANAFFGPFTWDMEDIVKFVLDAVAIPIAQQMVDKIVQDTVQWANTGFEGGPAYVTDTSQYFEDTADSAAGQFIEGSDLGFLCSPFKNSVKLSLRNAVAEPVDRLSPYSCTVSEISDNIEDFYDGNFNSGGWEAWFEISQNPMNTPYGAYIAADAEINSRIAKEIDLKEHELTINQGFKSLTECKSRNPSTAALKFLDDANGDTAELERLLSEFATLLTAEEKNGIAEALDYIENRKAYDLSKPGDSCIEGGAVLTAGATIKSQLDNVLPSGLEQIIRVESLEQLVGAFASGVLQRYVFGPKGLFSTENSLARANKETVDVDGDDIPDGWNTDLDAAGELEICHHGLKPKPTDVAFDDWGPSRQNCIKSGETASSPYFIPLCENVGPAILALENFQTFMINNEWDSRYAITWTNRIAKVDGNVDNLVSVLGSYEWQEFDPVINILSEYQKKLSLGTTELAKQGKLRHLTEGCPAGQSASACRREDWIDKTGKLINYMNDFNTRVVANRCANPDKEAVADLVEPDISTEAIDGPDDLGNEPDDTGDDTTATSTPPAESADL